MILDIEDQEHIWQVGRALSSEARAKILQYLAGGPKNVNEIAAAVALPQSSAVSHIKILEESGLIRTHFQPAVRGTMKVCSLAVDEVHIHFLENEEQRKIIKQIAMPVGHFVDYFAAPTCGIVSEKGPVGEEDEPRCFFRPERIMAQLIWLGRGYLEYRFPNDFFTSAAGRALEISAELCAEDHEYNPNYPSDITLWVNGLEVGTWTCPGDFGGRRGKWNPDWWPDKNTQYGVLKTWHVDSTGCYLDGEKTGDRPLEQFHLEQQDYISVRFGIREDAVHVGGMNIFGEHFGDYRQNILLKYIEQKEKE